MKLEVIDGVTYISMSDLKKEYQKRYLRHLNISQMMKDIPSEYKITKRGRESYSLLNLIAFDKILIKNRTFPVDFVKELKDRIGVEVNQYGETHELFIFSIIEGFIMNFFVDVSIIKQFSILDRTFDICIGGKILVEIDESGHKFKLENDKYKDQLSKNHGFEIIRVNPYDPYGKTVAAVASKVIEVLNPATKCLKLKK